MICNKKLIIGTANFFKNYGINGSFVNQKEKSKIYRYLEKNKFFTFDISKSYGYFEDDVYFFNLKKKIYFKLKLKDLNNIGKNLNDILLKLNISKFECLMMHDENELLTKKGLSKFNELLLINKKKFIFKNIGVSIYSLNTVNAILDNNIKVDIVQLPMNVFDQKFSNIKILEKLKKRKIKVHVRSIFLQGLLLKDSNSIRNKILKKKMINFENFVKKNNSRKIDLCIDYIKSVKYVDKIVIGFDNLKQLKTITENFKIKKKNISYSKFCQIQTNLTDPRKWKKILV